MIAFYDREVGGTAKSNIQALRDAAKFVGLKWFEEQSLDSEFRDWKKENRNWLIQTFNMVEN